LENKPLKRLEFSINYLLNKTVLYCKIASLQAFKQNNFDITPEQFGVLYILSHEDGLYQRQLSQLTLKDRPNISRILNILEENEYIYRKPDPENKRIMKVFITEKGRTQVEAMLPCAYEVRNKAIKGLTENDLENLARILQIVRSNLEESFKLQI